MIEIIDLHKRFADTPVLQGASLSIKTGEVSVLLGPSGGGKSTLLRAINGLEPADRGSVQIANVRLDYPRPSPGALNQVRRLVGMVFQQYQLFPHLTVLGNVTEAPRRVLGVAREEAESSARLLLDRVGLGDKIDARPAKLSGGQQQRVAIVRALAMHPKVILFDEPTSALDPAMTAEVTSVIQDLASSGQTMLIVTHALAFARRVAHRVHVILGGRIVESGTPEAVLDQASQPETRKFLEYAKEQGLRSVSPT